MLEGSSRPGALRILSAQRLRALEASSVFADGMLLQDASQRRAALEKAVALNGESALYRNSLGAMYVDLKEHEKALEQFQAAWRSDLAAVWNYYMAESLLGRQQMEQALAAFKRSLLDGPEKNRGEDIKAKARERIVLIENYLGHIALAEKHEKDREYDKAVAEVKTALGIIETSSARGRIAKLEAVQKRREQENRRANVEMGVTLLVVVLIVGGVIVVGRQIAARLAAKKDEALRGPEEERKGTAAAAARAGDIRPGESPTLPEFAPPSAGELSSAAGNPERCEEVARRYARAGKSKDLVGHAVKMNPAESSAYGRALLAAGDYDAAFEVFKRVSRLSGQDQLVLSFLKRVIRRRRAGTMFSGQERYAERLELGIALAGLGLGREAVGVLDESVLRAASREETDAYVVADVFEMAGQAGEFIKRLPEGSSPDARSTYAAAFGKKRCQETALALLKTRGELAADDFPVLIAAHAGLGTLEEIEPPGIPERHRALLAEGLVESGKEEAGLHVLSTLGRNVWKAREYSCGLRALQRLGRPDQVRKLFEEAERTLSIDKAPEVYYFFALFSERQVEFERAKGLYRDLVLKLGGYRDADIRLKNLEAIPAEELTRASTVLTSTNIRETLSAQGKPASVETPQAGIVAGRFELIRPLGVGGMGIVYRALDMVDKKVVALKKMLKGMTSDPKAKDRFREEARTLASLSHPAIVRVFDVVESAGEVYMSMELVDGETLAEVLAGRKKLSPAECVGIMETLLGALEHAHAENVVHRDIKPGNLMLDRKGALKVMDFGIALHGEDARGTTGGRPMGTPAYMAPEQHEGTADARSDIYTVGATLYELLTGNLPFTAGNLLGLKKGERYQELASSVPKNLKELVSRCLKADPARRPQSPRECLKILRGQATDAPVAA